MKSNYQSIIFYTFATHSYLQADVEVLVKITRNLSSHQNYYLVLMKAGQQRCEYNSEIRPQSNFKKDSSDLIVWKHKGQQLHSIKFKTEVELQALWQTLQKIIKNQYKDLRKQMKVFMPNNSTIKILCQIYEKNEPVIKMVLSSQKEAYLKSLLNLAEQFVKSEQLEELQCVRIILTGLLFQTKDYYVRSIFVEKYFEKLLSLYDDKQQHIVQIWKTLCVRDYYLRLGQNWKGFFSQTHQKLLYQLKALQFFTRIAKELGLDNFQEPIVIKHIVKQEKIMDQNYLTYLLRIVRIQLNKELTGHQLFIKQLLPAMLPKQPVQDIDSEDQAENWQSVSKYYSQLLHFYSSNYEFISPLEKPIVQGLFMNTQALRFLQKITENRVPHAIDLIEAYSKAIPLIFLSFLIENQKRNTSFQTDQNQYLSLLQRMLLLYENGNLLGLKVLQNLIINIRTGKIDMQSSVKDIAYKKQSERGIKLLLMYYVSSFLKKRFSIETKLAALSVVINCIKPFIKRAALTKTLVLQLIYNFQGLLKELSVFITGKAKKRKANLLNAASLLKVLIQSNSLANIQPQDKLLINKKIIQCQFFSACLQLLRQNIAKNNLVSSSFLACLKQLENLKAKTALHEHLLQYEQKYACLEKYTNKIRQFTRTWAGQTMKDQAALLREKLVLDALKYQRQMQYNASQEEQVKLIDTNQIEPPLCKKIKTESSNKVSQSGIMKFEDQSTEIYKSALD